MTMENEDKTSKGYFLRSKKRKLENGKERAVFKKLPNLKRKTKCPILELPSEILRKIFKLLPYQELNKNVRLVNRRFKTVAECFLNASFKLLDGRIQQLLKSTTKALQASQDDMEIKCFCRLINMLEIIKFQQSVVVCTIWRYVYNDRYPNHRSSMYAGLLMDTYEDFLWKFTHTPNDLYAAVIVRDYSMPTEVNHIVQLTKTFCLHFEKVSEENANVNLMVSGCKLLDLLDCGAFAQRDVIYENVEKGMFEGRYNYYFSNSWFVALNIRSDRQMTWKQKQRMMHMRVRRIVLAHTEMFMQQCHYERELMLRSAAVARLREPSNNVYTGYGDIHDKFFYYGVMNDGAYLRKFHADERGVAANGGEEFDFNDAPPEAPPPFVEDEGEDYDDDDVDADEATFNETPFLGIMIDAKVACPLSHAPLRFLDANHPLDPLARSPSSRRQPRRAFALRVEIECVGARHPRLPTKYSYSYKQKR